jgi:hypothetical protein
MSITQLKQALELNTKLLQEASELKAWSDLMIQRQNILNMLIERLEAINEFKKVG